MTPPIVPSPRDLALLEQALRRGDPGAKLKAIEEVTRLAEHARPLLPFLTEEVRNGHLVLTTFHAVGLLQALPDRDLFDALVARGALERPSILDKCAMLTVELGDFEDDLCTYLYQNWHRSDEPRIREILTTFRARGSHRALDTLRAIQPELAERVRTADAQTALRRSAPEDSASDALSPLDKVLRRFAKPVDSERLDLLHQAVAAIEGRLASES